MTAIGRNVIIAIFILFIGLALKQVNVSTMDINRCSEKRRKRKKEKEKKRKKLLKFAYLSGIVCQQAIATLDHFSPHSNDSFFIHIILSFGDEQNFLEFFQFLFPILVYE